MMTARSWKARDPAEAWSVEQIDARTTTLVDQVMGLFTMTEDQPCA